MADLTRPDMTAVAIRDATPGDAEQRGRIFAAFESIASRHGFPVEVAFVAERGGAVAASVFLDERSSIVGVGPVTVEPQAMDAGAGRALMKAALERERDRRVAAVRLAETAYPYRSLALYAKLGFDVREPLSVVRGNPPAVRFRDTTCGPRASTTSPGAPSCACVCTAMTEPGMSRCAPDDVRDLLDVKLPGRTFGVPCLTSRKISARRVGRAVSEIGRMAVRHD